MRRVASAVARGTGRRQIGDSLVRLRGKPLEPQDARHTDTLPRIPLCRSSVPSGRTNLLVQQSGPLTTQIQQRILLSCSGQPAAEGGAMKRTGVSSSRNPRRPGVARILGTPDNVPWRSIALVLSAVMCGTTGCATTGVGLSPIHPKHGEWIKEDVIQLEWEPATEEADETRYQLCVFKGNDKISMYQVGDLVEPEHVMTGDFEPGAYKWMVRPMFLRNGAWHPGEWSYRKYFYFAVVVFGWKEEMYEFKLKQPIHTPVIPKESEVPRV